MLKSIGRRLRAVQAHHRGRWAEWVHTMAAGGDEPTAADVVETAIALQIPDPGERLSADVDIVRAVAAAERTVATCEADRAALLQPFDGSLEKLRAAVAAAKAEHDRLAAIARPFDEWPNEWFAKSEANRLRQSRPDLFPTGNF